MKNSSPCPCGLNSTYENCCKPFHDGQSLPETAERLMRSRYSAYVVGAIDYIDVTNDPTSKDAFDREAAAEWSSQSEWLGLEIVATRDGKKGDREGEVEFKAKYRFDGKEQTHHEVSLFRIGQAGRWIYCDGKTIQEPIQRAEPKVGRNDPCACGSGKKFKKCCAS